MRLPVHRFGSTDATGGRRLAALHGFTQTSSSWAPIAEMLGRNWEITALDLPGHGGASRGDRSLPECADDVAETLAGTPTEMPADSPGTRAPILLGYSMGARIALHVALLHPGSISALVLVSGTAGIDDATERTARVAADETLAERLETIGVERFVEEWLARPMFATLPRAAAGVGERLTNSATGLADSLRHAGTGTQRPLWGDLADIAVPTLVVTGDLDTKFTALGDRLAGSIPRSHRVRIAGAGHTVHLERPTEFVAALTEWAANLS